jgi:hypothetical protein
LGSSDTTHAAAAPDSDAADRHRSDSGWPTESILTTPASLNLELYVHHSMMDDFHARIWADGFVEELAAMRLWVQFDPCVPTSRDEP